MCIYPRHLGLRVTHLGYGACPLGTKEQPSPKYIGRFQQEMSGSACIAPLLGRQATRRAGLGRPLESMRADAEAHVARVTGLACAGAVPTFFI